ncbi:hypothetical protein Leryth_008298 [Lithospermum erythrorhizon]|nr:hypothetical protein Leryth_008298 [Lithospermum erythrorhizon]
MMVFVSTLLGILGFAIGLSIGLLIGFIFFIYSKPADVEDPVVKPLEELNDERLEDLMLEIPFWVKKPEYERIGWLNKFIFHMWPFLDKSICSMIRSTANQTFDEYVGKFMIQSIEFEKLSIGNLPPTLHGSFIFVFLGRHNRGLKFCETDDNDLVMEPAICWAGNPDIVVGLTISSVKVKLQLVDVHVFAAPRVTLEPLVPIIPCFGKVVASLIEKPTLDFGLKILGGDVMAIPGLYHYIQETIKTEIMKMFMWPKFLDIPMLDESLIAPKKPVGMLHVKVVKAMNLLKMDWFGLSDPYVKLSLSEDTLPSEETSIQKKTLNPVWNESFMLIVKDPQSQFLNINVYDWDKGKRHDKLGMQIYHLKFLEVDETIVVELDLAESADTIDQQNKKQRGMVVLELTYTPLMEDVDTSSSPVSGITEEDTQIGGRSFTESHHGAGLLSVAVHGAEDVEGVHHTNPYALILFKGERRKSKCIRGTRNPHWDEEFQFKLDESPREEQICVRVMSKRPKISLWRKECLGYVDINLNDVVNNGRIKQKYHLIESKNGIIHVDLEWKPIKEHVQDKHSQQNETS